ncbi:MAG: thioredoxin-dependent thiol peroxidase [Bacteroidales bacterium]|nr:thioredoxin-dependent thiol peroxidase [Bacteroidales bacterium]
MSQLSIGDPAPDIQSADQNGNPVTLGSFIGKKVILFFYPKDNTPGCTAEACNLRDNYQILIDKGFEIIGVSADDERSHKNFSDKYVLPFPLISDKAKKTIMDYGVWGKKKNYGKEYEGINRMTFIIDEAGKIAHIFTKVDTKNHTAQILKTTEV